MTEGFDKSSPAKADDDLVGAYVALAAAGVAFEDRRLAVLREAMTPREREQTVAALATEVLRQEPIPPRAN